MSESRACAIVESHLGSPGRGVLKPEKDLLAVTGSFALVLAHYAIRVTQRGGVEAFEAEDGKTLYYLRPANVGGGICALSQGGGDEKVLDKAAQRDWVVYGEGLCYVSREAGPVPVVECLGVDTGEVRRVAEVPGHFDTGGMAISPDGLWILYTREDPSGDDLMLLENFR